MQGPALVDHPLPIGAVPFHGDRVALAVLVMLIRSNDGLLNRGRHRLASPEGKNERKNQAYPQCHVHG